MPLNRGDPWDQHLDSLDGGKGRPVSESELVVNCLHVLLGVKSDFFKLTADNGFMINVELVDRLRCPHLSPILIKNILKDIASHATRVHAVRLAVRGNRIARHPSSKVTTEWGDELLGELETWILQRIADPGISLLELEVYSKQHSKPFAEFLMCKEMERGENDLRFSEYCSRLFVLSEPANPRTRRFILNHRPETEVGEQAEPGALPDELIYTPEVFTVPANLIRESVDPSWIGKTYFVCYVNENRIVSS